MDQGTLSVKSEKASQLVEEEVQFLLARRAVEVALPCEDQFTSCLFLVRKKNGSHQLVITLKPLNGYVQKQHFKMEGLVWWKISFSQTLDVFLGPQGCVLLSIHCQGTLWISPFLLGWLDFMSLSASHRTFTKLLCPAMALLHSQGVRLISLLTSCWYTSQRSYWYNKWRWLYSWWSCWYSQKSTEVLTKTSSADPIILVSKQMKFLSVKCARAS